MEALRAKYAGQPIAWSGLRLRIVVMKRPYRRLHPGALAANLKGEGRRLKVGKKAHRRWPAAVPLAATGGAAPEFRASLAGYLLAA